VEPLVISGTNYGQDLEEEEKASCIEVSPQNSKNIINSLDPLNHKTLQI
jgi:hypothetical protein